MHAEIATFVREHRLPAELIGPLTELCGRIRSDTQLSTQAWSFHLGPSPTEAPTEERPRVAERYEDLGLIGVGGMGEVRRVRDRELNRIVAMKLVKPEAMARPAALARFIEEAQVGAQLQHAGMAPVHELGQLPDGRWYFTMKEIRGRTLTDAVRDLHRGPADDFPTGLRQLVEAYRKACHALGYAHARGVIHRDLKPENLLLGEYGEVLVIDWGLAKVIGGTHAPEESVVTERSEADTHRTRVGAVAGTLAYMPPEQARGEVNALDQRSDVYALGAVLYEVLAGRPPYMGRDGQDLLRQVLAGPPAPLRTAAGAQEASAPLLPRELVVCCERAMSRAAQDRHASAADLAAEVTAWLDGALRRERALQVVSAADALSQEADALDARASTLRSEGAALLAGVKLWEPEERKAAGWAKADEADRLSRGAALLELKREAGLEGALTHAPDLPEAHAALAQLELGRHAAAEVARDEAGAARAAVRLQEHADALPPGHAVRTRAAVYLRGDGALTLVTDPPGARVLLHRYEPRNRRLVPVPMRDLGRAPLAEVSLPMGSYLCELRHPERPVVRYPVCIGRGEHWDGVRPGSRVAEPVRLPLPGELGPEDDLVPAGWFWAGGDPISPGTGRRRRLWCDELVVRRFPVTNREYLVFLDDLVARGHGSDAERYAPRERAAGGGGSSVYGRDDAGRFVLRRDGDGDVWEPEWPVMLVDWFGATAYAAWLAERTGRPWRLPCELEWEKAARGADGRFFPWGDAFDASWCCASGSHPGRPLPRVVDSFPVDESAYGVRGLGGNVQDWCSDVYRSEHPNRWGATIVSPEATGPSAGPDLSRVHRGGSWVGSSRNARAAVRFRSEATNRSENLGFRLAYRPGST